MSDISHGDTTSADAPLWRDIMDALPLTQRPRRLTAAMAQDWSLALRAVGIPHRLTPLRKGWRLDVHRDFMDLAVDEVLNFAQENPPEAPPEAARPISRRVVWQTALIMLLGALFHTVCSRPLPSLDLYPETWVTHGAADASAIMAGEWWRTVTALTLHADAAHMAGNALIGGVFMVLFCSEAGFALGWSVFLLSGALGNLLNAAAHLVNHVSVGASTAVFGVVAALGAYRAMREHGVSFRRTVAPVVAGLALLAMLGVGGERTDLGAHAFGFLAGLPLGLLAGSEIGVRLAAHPALPRLCGALSIALPLAAWAAALL